MPIDTIVLILVAIILVLIIGIDTALTLWAARIYIKK